MPSIIIRPYKYSWGSNCSSQRPRATIVVRNRADGMACRVSKRFR